MKLDRKMYKLDDAVKIKLRNEIYMLEKQNQKDKKYSDADMKKLIIKMIEREVKKCY